jgi:hypothetical protein
MYAAGAQVSAQVDANTDSLRKQWAKLQGDATVSVPCQSLDSILDQERIRRATLLSLDVEGAEPIVMSNVRAERFRFVTVEADGREPTKDAQVASILVSAGLAPVESLWLPFGANYIEEAGRQLLPAPLAYRHDRTRGGPFGPGGIAFVLKLRDLLRKYNPLMSAPGPPIPDRRSPRQSRVEGMVRALWDGASPKTDETRRQKQNMNSDAHSES